MLNESECGKTCPACGVAKPRSDFGRNKQRKDGMSRTCFHCTRAKHNAWALRVGYNKKPSKKAWREANKERLAAKRHTPEWRAKRCAWNIKWRTENPEKYALLMRRTLERDPGRLRRNKAAEAARHPERFMLRSIYHRTGSRLKNLQPETVVWLGIIKKDPCSYCGSYDNPQVDHVVPLSRHGGVEWDNLAPACKSCNSSKHNRSLLRFLLTRSA